MSKKKLLKNGLVALTTATFIMGMVEPAFSQDRGRRGDGNGRRGDGNGRRGNGDGQTRNNNGSTTTTTTTSTSQRRSYNQDHIKRLKNRYIGTRSFKLNKDRKLQNHKKAITDLEGQLAPVTKKVAAAKKTLAAAKKALSETQDSINTLNDQIVQAVTKKSQLNSRKSNLQGKIPGLESEITLAQAANDQIAGEVAKISKNLEKKKTQLQTEKEACDAAPTEQCQKKVTRLQNAVKKIEENLAAKQVIAKTASDNLKKKKGALRANAKKIADINKEISDIEAQNATRTQTLATKKAELNGKKQAVTNAQNTLNPLVAQEKDLTTKLIAADDAKHNYEVKLVNRILEMNREGARAGAADGGQAGSRLANVRGTEFGSLDGNNDGLFDGERNGRDRDYQLGLEDGDRIGAARANDEGRANGTADGTVRGNIDAATSEGEAAGTVRANNSDADAVGTAQGKRDGMARAIRVGDQEGTRIGENEAISNFEDVRLNSANVDGPFAGSFARVVPAYPRGFRGRNFAPNIRLPRQVVADAYADAYVFRYRAESRIAYNSLIDSVYNNVYSNTYNAAYATAFGTTYSDEIQRGRADGERRTYDNLYPGIYDNFFNQARAQFSRNPDRASSEYKETFARVEKETYARVYEEIRAAAYRRVENQTFNDNIDEQREIFRKKRLAEVTKIYKNNAVLSFVDSSITDTGINGVAAQDGVFMPGESTAHSVTIDNFGEKAATNVKVTLQDGSSSTIASIPAKSRVSIKGAIKGTVNGRAGQSINKVLRVYSKITSEARIQGRHFANASQGLLNSGDVKRIAVNFPLALTGMSLDGDLVLNEQNKLRVNVINNSKRNYKGPLKIEVVTNSRSNILTKGFGDLQSLRQQATLTDANVKVSDNRDAYTPLKFNAIISKNGVILGSLNSDFVTMAKAPFKDIKGAPVLVASADREANEILDIVSELGGIERVSVLDLSLRSKNSAILKKGLTNKTILVADNGSARTIREIEETLVKTKDSAVVLINHNGNALSSALSLNSFKDATKAPFSVAGVSGVKNIAFTNPHMVKGLADSLVVTDATFRNFLSTVALADNLKKTGEELISEMSTRVNRSNFLSLNASDRQIVQVLSILSLGEIMNINLAYDESGGLFSRNKKYAKMIEKDKSLLMNQLKAKVKATRANSSTEGLFLSAISVSANIYAGIKDFDPIQDDMMGKITNAVSKYMVRKTDDMIEDKLEDHDEDLFEKAEDNRLINAPFKARDSRDTRNNCNTIQCRVGGRL